METLLVVLVVLLVTGSPFAVAVVPPVVMGALRRWSMAGVALWFLGLGLLAVWMAAASADMDRADATGGAGSILAGVGWLVAAVGAATGSVVTVRRKRRPTPAAG